ncbi:MAG: gamma-glutamyltransferase family protein [Anaerolinea sp.]|nr:gamma-glutamyltransferase family protein [Anaerolinea sp.]
MSTLTLDAFSRRSNVLARRGMVATSQPLAAMAGLRMLLEGGNAADAAVATAAALAVVEPMSTGIGGDAFALFYDAAAAPQQRISALNGSGRAPAGLHLEDLRRAGLSEIGLESPHSVTVPGTVAAWADLLARHGTMPLAVVLQPAIEYARDGFPVSELIAASWQRGEARLGRLPSGRELLPGGRAPRLGEVVQLPELARSLQAIADGGAAAFYQGEIGRRIAAFVQELGGCLAVGDLASHRSTWDQPIAIDYRGLRVWECPPNGQGLAALLALGIVAHDDLAAAAPAERWHLLIEAMRLAWADARRWVADPAFVDLPLAELLAAPYLAGRRSQIDPRRANLAPASGLPNADRRPLQPAPRADTVYLSVVDGQGNACSFINSLFHGFGSGLVAPGTGVALQNRGALFDLNPDHPNCLAPGKRPYHTIIPALATRGDELWACFGVMGGFMQPQGHLQVLVNLLDLAMLPQEALDAPRFCLPDGEPGGPVAVEAGAGEALIAELRARGHDVTVMAGMERTLFGVGQVICRDVDSGVLTAGSDPRRDGCALGW